MSLAPGSTEPLDIKFDTYEPQNANELSSLLAPANRSRVRSINITSTGRTVARDLVAVIGAAAMPRLETLVLDVYNEEDEDEDDFTYAFEEEKDPDDLLVDVARLPIQAPSLHTVTLHNICLPWNAALFSQFVTFKIDIDGLLNSRDRTSHLTMRDILIGMHALKHLFLGDIFPGYPQSLPANLPKVIMPSTCRSITLRADKSFWDFLCFAPSLEVSAATRLNLVITNHTDCAELLRHFTSDPLIPRGARIEGYDSVESDYGCEAVSFIQDATAWLESPQTALLSTPASHTHFRFRASPSGRREDEETNYDHHRELYVDSLRAIDLSQLQVLHLRSPPYLLLEPMLNGDEMYKTFHPTLRHATSVEVLIISGECGFRPFAFYDALAGRNTANEILCPSLRTLLVALYPTEDFDDSFDEQTRESVKRLLQVRRDAGIPLQTLQVHRSFEDHPFWGEIGDSVQIEFFDTTESAHNTAMEWDWQAWPPT